MATYLDAVWFIPQHTPPTGGPGRNEVYFTSRISPPAGQAPAHLYIWDGDPEGLGGHNHLTEIGLNPQAALPQGHCNSLGYESEGMLVLLNDGRFYVLVDATGMPLGWAGSLLYENSFTLDEQKSWPRLEANGLIAAKDDALPRGIRAAPQNNAPIPSTTERPWVGTPVEAIHYGT